MRPLDARVRPHLRVARAPLSVVLGGNLVLATLVIAQAFAMAALVVALLGARDWQEPAWWLLGVSAGRAAVGWLVDVAAARAAARVGAHLRGIAVEAALALPAHAATQQRTGELTTLVTRGAGAVEPYLTRYLPALVLAGVLPVLTVIAIASADWWAALVVVLTLPLVPVFAILIGLSTAEHADRQWRRLGDLAGHFLDVVRGLPTLVAHNRGEAQVATVRAVTHRYRKATGETLRLAFASSAALELIATISVALVAVLVGLRLAAGGLGLETALVVLLLAPEAYWPLRKVGAEYHAAAEGTATFEAIHELTSAAAVSSGAVSSGAASSGAVSSGAVSETPVLGSRAPLVLSDVTLAWPGREPVIRGLNATIAATGLTVITGASGSGKSTLVQALLGELAVRDGEIRIGDVVLDDCSTPRWQRHLAQVPQRPWLSPGTIAANLRIGRPGASDDDLWTALAAVRLSEAVAALPEKLATRLGDDGAGLSAGQRARLALARVMLAERGWVILDEPTAHLDAETEQVLLDTLRDLARTRCVIAVAHRPALIEAADHVLALPEPAAAPPAPVVAESDPESEPVPAGSARAVVAAPTETADVVPRWRWGLAVFLAVAASASGVALTATAGWLIARAAEQPPVMMLTLAIVGVRTFGLARPAFRYAERLVSHDVALSELAERRATLYGDLVPLVPARTGRRGDALTGLVDDVDALLDDRLRVRLPLWTWCGVGVIATAFGWLLLPAAGPVIAAVALLGLPVFALARLGVARAEPDLIRLRGELGRDVHDALGAARQLTLWQARGPVTAHLARLAHDQARAAIASASAVATARALAVLGSGLGVVAAAAVGAEALAAGELSGPMLALLVLVPLALADVVTPLADAGALRVRTRAAADRLAVLTSRTPAVHDPTEPELPAPGRAPLRLRELDAGWHDRPVLRRLDLDLPPGARIGITGPSGSGKSTLAAVLMRFLGPAAGHHTLADVDVDRFTVAAIRDRVGLIDDDPYVFASTVAENVRLARLGAPDAEVEHALRAAHLGEWLDGLPDGLSTRIGEGGSAISGGERARLGLARAMLADKPVLVLDEPTAHLDTATATAVVEDLLAASTGRSLVWITHDGIGLAAMDQVLDLGAPAARGAGV